jgi:Methionine biosynthesis protein MetW
MLFGYRWWQTGHIHQLSLTDFRDLIGEVGLTIVDSKYRRSRNPVVDAVYRAYPNLFTTLPVFKLHRADPIPKR